ncbi:MAG: transcriptional regulator [Actinomycetota bacterium]
MVDPLDALEEAHAAAARADWPTAFDRFIEADAAGLVTTGDLPVLAGAAYATGHLDATVEAWERAHAGCLAAGDAVNASAAAVKVALHLLIDTGLMAPVRGWARRAERLLEGSDESPVHAWLAVVRMYERLLSGDFKTARKNADLAIELGLRYGERAATALGRVAQARILIFDGDMSGGLALLDEAAVPAMSGELDALSAGIVFCELLCACQGLGEFERAREWTAAMESWRATQGVGSLGGRCRVHRAELLRIGGACIEAEEQALRACEELRPYLRLEFGWPLSELGRIRRVKGDLDGAEESLLAAHEIGWDPQPELAMVRLARGDVKTAAAMVRDALERPLNVPSKELPPNNQLRRAPLLAAQVEIAIAAGDIDGARTAADELEAISRSLPSTAIRASAALARARVLLSKEDAAGATRAFEDSLRSWNEIGAPYEAAITRTGLAEAYRQAGQHERAQLELRSATSALDRIRGTQEEAIEPARAEPVAENAFQREGDFWSISFDGRVTRIRDLIGLRYIAKLLAEPEREFLVLDLVSGGIGSSVEDHAGELLDARAKDAYRRRLSEIEEELSTAEETNDFARAARADAERAFLVRELSRAVGLTGRDRLAGDASERARASVTRAIRHAIRRIAAHDADLGAHLDRTIRTGTYCGYSPDPRANTTWRA